MLTGQGLLFGWVGYVCIIPKCFLIPALIAIEQQGTPPFFIGVYALNSFFQGGKNDSVSEIQHRCNDALSALFIHGFSCTAGPRIQYKRFFSGDFCKCKKASVSFVTKPHGCKSLMVFKYLYEINGPIEAQVSVGDVICRLVLLGPP